MWLTLLSLRRPVSLAMILVTIILLGTVSIFKLPLDFLPQVEMPFIAVFIPYSGGIPSENEREIVKPIEEVLATLGGVKEIFSFSDADQVQVGVTFDWGRDVNLLRMEVKEKIDQIRGDLPEDIQQIMLLTFNTNDIPIIEGRIAAKGRDLSESWDLLDQKIIAPLSRIPGVGRVNIDGVLPTQASVYLRFDKIMEYGVDVTHLFQELESANVELTVGRITDRGLRYDLRTVSGLSGVEDLKDLPIDSRGLRLSDVAEVVYGAPSLSYGRVLNREPAIAFWIQKASGYNTVEVCRAIERELEEINRDPTLAGINSFTFFNQADQITDSLRSLLQGGLIGSLLAIAILYIFLRRFSMTLVVSIAIPLSILGTCIFMYLTGRSLNVLTMMGLMLGVGMLVDNAVVVLESIHRRQHRGASPLSAAVRGTREVARAIVASTLTTIIVFAPVVITKADELAVWLGEVGVTISVTLVFSLLISLTVIPALSVRMTRGGGSSQMQEARWLVWLQQRYQGILNWTAIKHPLITVLVLVPAVLGITVGAMKITNFKPDDAGDQGMRRENLYVSFVYSGPVDKDTSKAYTTKVAEYLESRRQELTIRDIYSYFTADAAGVSLFFEEGVVSEEFYRSVREDLRENLPVQAGLEYLFGGEDGQDSGAKTFSMTIFGEETEALQDFAQEAMRRLALVEGLEDLHGDGDDGHSEIQVKVDSDQAGRFGIAPGTIAQILGLTYRGVQLPRLQTGEKEIDLVVSLLPDDQESIENLSLLTVGVVDGRPVRLAQVVDLEFGKSPDRIFRRDQRTGVTIRGTWEGDKLSDGLDVIRPVMDGLDLPFGYGWNFGGEILRSREQQNEMGTNMLLALACVFFVMASLFESLLYPMVVMGTVPFASLGVFWLMMATGTPFNIMAMIGMVILIGIVVNNGIVLVDHINSWRRSGLSLDEAVVEGCRDRLRPILMTAGTTILGLMPLALSHGAHVGGAEYFPMARAIIGGLASSTFLTLLVMPTYYRLATLWMEHLQLGMKIWPGFRAKSPKSMSTG
ncbi:MAG: efflux RND transporter permease subunit [Gemmatimonadales bacterium]|nr:efflux RND transporter permease subunit [Gemmatimonadales bacterium]